MSVRFKSFLTRVGKHCEFKPLNNALLNYLTKESENKYKNYPKLLNLMKKYWPKYGSNYGVKKIFITNRL